MDHYNRKKHDAAYRKKHKEEIRKAQGKYYLDHKEEILQKQQDNAEKLKQYHKQYYQDNKEILSKKGEQWRKDNAEKVKLYQQVYWSKEKSKEKRRKRYEENIQVRISKRVSSSIRKALMRRSSSKRKKSTFEVLPYTPMELKEHLEKQFEPWMNWDNWGVGTGCWNIDHIKPDVSFNYKEMTDKDFLKCWSLENLRPLDAIENIRKGASLIN